MKPSFLLLLALATAAVAEFEIRDDPDEKQLNVIQNGHLIGRYMYDFDNSSGRRRDETFKTYLQVFDPTGELAITKALGGDFDHHRGIFIGWGKLTVDGESFDVWHGHGGAQIHQEFTERRAGHGGATLTSRMIWEKGKNGPPILEEHRTMTFLTPPKPAYAMIDVASRLKPLGGEAVTLDGDPEHAGLQFRVASELDRSKTLYLYPAADARPHHDVDYPWIAASFALEDRNFVVIYLNHPENPPNAKYSAYRDYARFGAFYKATIENHEELTIRVRFLVIESKDFPPADWIQERHNEFTGIDLPTPQTTQRGPH